MRKEDIVMKRKKRHILAAFCCIFILIAGGTNAGWAAEEQKTNISFSIDGEQWENRVFVEQPFCDDGNFMQVPLSYITAWGYGVRFYDDSLTAQVFKRADSSKMAVVPFQVQHGVPYIPLRTTLNALGDKVLWNEKDRQIYVEKDGLEKEIQVHFIDVGEGDATLIDAGEFEVLIDAGPNTAGETVVNYLKPYVDGPLDLVIATHVHHDHIGGMDDVLKAYEVKKLIHCGDTYDTQSYKDYYAAVQQQPDCEYIKDEDMTIDLGGGAVLRILNIMDGSENLNDNSVVARLEYGTVKVLFTGDIEQGAELNGLESFGQVDVLKVPHHGSSTSSTEKFLQVTKPKLGIISAGYGNLPKHPHLRALKRLFAAQIPLYGTYKSGTIVLTTDGMNYRINTDQALTLKDAGIYHIPAPVQQPMDETTEQAV